MKLRRVLAVARREVLHIARDPRSLGMGIVIPALLLVLYGYALSLDVDHIPFLAWDQSATRASRDLVSRFEASPYFSLRGHARGYQEITHAIDSGVVLVALVIPVDFADRLEADRVATVQMIVDGSNANTATLAIGYADTLISEYSQRLAVEAARRLSGETIRLPLDVRPRVWFNTDLESRTYIIPGLIAVIMMIVAGMLTSLTVAREWEAGTMEQLISTPLKAPELILGKLIPYFGIGMLDVAIAVLTGEFLFRVPLRGSVSLLFGMAAIFLVGVLAMGILISVLAKTQLLASQLAQLLTYLPAFLLSGFIFDIANMPKAIQLLTHVVPARYFVALLKGIYLKAIGLEVLGPEAVLLTVFGLTVTFLAIMTFKKRMG